MTKKQREKLIVKMRKFIEDSGVSKDELPGIIEALKRPKPAEVKAKQVKAFIEFGYPDAMGISEKRFKDLVSIPKDEPGALLVVSPKAVSIFAQLNLVGIKNYLDLAELKDTVETSGKLIYWIYDVEDGTKMLGKSPKTCRALFRKQSRRGLTVVETIALYIQNPEILKDHYIDISGSSYGSNRVPCLFSAGDGPELGCVDVDFTDSYYDSASCGN